METGLVSIELISKLHSINIDMEAVKRRYFAQEELKPEEVQRILKDHGIRARLKNLDSVNELLKYPMPIILVLESGYAVLVGKKDDRFLVFDCEKKQKP